MQHIGFIMDGNRRWAKKLGNLALAGHTQGGENVEQILELCLTRAIPYVSMWALSKENIEKRSPLEIEGIFTLFRKRVPLLILKLQKAGIRFEWIGNPASLPDDIREILENARRETESCKKMTFILAIAYSGQDEIVRGIQKCLSLGIDPDSLDEQTFLTYIDSGKYPPPDVIVRTGGDIRHSGYFLYQSAYSEYFFTDTLWPDFSERDLDETIMSFEGIKRNFGK